MDTTAKLTVEQKLQAAAEVEGGAFHKATARKYGMTPASLYYWRERRKHLLAGTAEVSKAPAQAPKPQPAAEPAPTAERLTDWLRETASAAAAREVRLEKENRELRDLVVKQALVLSGLGSVTKQFQWEQAAPT